ncbi:hypothetical protein [Mycobacteroides abscessus]|uniref:hypothetical protein n=1 Tax=Mycobacteroides abscessus TaxID=36809 RepID=UPI00092C9257|nr:hypothetical protein [Mycobacteroides abscessus]MBN7371114.1 hypothetical protein [Mycobacteroides abscessus subsp. abscessus]MBN7521282.1 hypothetical protein [Mycobacteroides abscessus subsp. abscessus]MDB2185150.1 hypothetical protein [Mycobacteroides abscessus subsp. abscessus]MDO3123497.1 hypothetical protein [Mycobacteroides abscessus subsp. abscessus]MDO3173308.1 hypothetical protein [Mycobacteroides abscessus subsp. abscessus]
MAFKTPPPEAVGYGRRSLPNAIAAMSVNHSAAVKALLAAADASAGPVDPTVTLAAIKAYRGTRRVVDGKEVANGREAVHDVLRIAARQLIAAGLPPGRVCHELGFGRTAMQEFMATDNVYRTLLAPGKRPVRKAVR